MYTTMERYFENSDKSFDYDNDSYNESGELNTEGIDNGGELIPYMIFGSVVLYFSYHIYNGFIGLRDNQTNSMINDSLINDSLIHENIIGEIKKLNGKYRELSTGLILKNSSSCSICLEEYEKEDDIIILKCSHIYHDKCIMGWLNKDISCPMCRQCNLL